MWNLEEKTPVTDWERRIDELMARQIAVARRSGAQDALQRGAEDFLRARADRLFRRAAYLRRPRRAGRQPDALGVPPAAVLAPGDGGGRSLIRYFARRLAFALFLVIAVSSASLMLARLAPGDFVTESLGTGASQQTIAQQRARYGLDKSIVAQYRDWLASRRQARPRLLHAVRPPGSRPDSRAGSQHRHPRRHRSGAGHAHRPAAGRHRRKPAQRRRLRRDPRGLAGSALDAAAADVAVSRLRRRAHGLASHLRDAIGQRAG